MTMLSVTRKGDPEQQLTELAKRLAAAIDRCDDAGKLANLARQYRETILRLPELKAGDGDDDDHELDDLIAGAKATRPRRAD